MKRAQDSYNHVALHNALNRLRKSDRHRDGEFRCGPFDSRFDHCVKVVFYSQRDFEFKLDTVDKFVRVLPMELSIGVGGDDIVSAEQ